MLWTKILLLLFVSAAAGATLGHYQAEETEEVPAGADGTEDAGVGDPPEVEEPADNSLFSRNLLSTILGDPAADGPGLDPEAEPGTDSDGPAVVEPTGEAVAKEQPSSPEEEENDIRPVQTNQDLERPLTQEDDSWSLNSVRSSFQTVHGYFGSLVELVGGQDGVCQYRCRYGDSPQPRPGYRVSEPDGCRSSLVGFQLDLGIPAMTQCCNQLDLCYETCGTNKYDCDSRFRSCLHDICSDLNKSLGFVTKVQACEAVADTLYNTLWTFGCRSYMNSQRAACVCEEEERDEL